MSEDRNVGFLGPKFLGLGLFSELPEEDREPFRQWLVSQNLEFHGDEYGLRDHLMWHIHLLWEKSDRAELLESKLSETGGRRVLVVGPHSGELLAELARQHTGKLIVLNARSYSSISELIDALNSHSECEGGCTIAICEIQHIGDLGPRADWQLRGATEKHRHINYVFASADPQTLGWATEPTAAFYKQLQVLEAHGSVPAAEAWLYENPATLARANRHSVEPQECSREEDEGREVGVIAIETRGNAAM